MDILDDYKNGVFYINLKETINSLDDLDSKVENIHDIMEAFFQFPPKEKWEKLETTLYILHEFSKFVDETILKKVLLEVESLFKENNETFVSVYILNNYFRSLKDYLKKILGVEDCQDFFNDNSIFFTVINRIKNQDLNDINKSTCAQILDIMIIIFERGEGSERLKEKIKQDLGSIIDMILLKFLFASISISYFHLDILLKIFKSEHLYLINSFYKMNPDNYSVRHYLSWLETKDYDIIKESIETLQTILKYTDSDIRKSTIYNLLEKADEINDEDVVTLQDFHEDILEEFANTLIDKIRALLTINAQDLDNS